MDFFLDRPPVCWSNVLGNVEEVRIFITMVQLLEGVGGQRCNHVKRCEPREWCLFHGVVGGMNGKLAVEVPTVLSGSVASEVVWQLGRRDRLGLVAEEELEQAFHGRWV